jgi:TOMM system kinase/cyclase fusion protein
MSGTLADTSPALPPGILPLGSRFRGAYEILEEIGVGTFGRVYRARQLSTGQPVAIKVLRFWHGQGPGQAENQVARFRRELRLSAELAHPNIVRLLDSGETEDGTLFAVFEHVDGATLKEVIEREGGLTWSDTVHLLSQVLDALACAHARGVVHRDLKPENIMVTKTGARRNALVLDFGLGGFARDAREQVLPRITATQEIMGTPCYAAPEQLRGETPSPRSDLYSWGLVFLECLTGEAAVGGASAQEIIVRQLGAEPVPIPACVRNRRLRELLQTVTAKAVERRDVTIEGLLHALQTLEPAEPESRRMAGEPLAAERRQVTVVSAGLTVTQLDGAPPDLEELDQILHAQHVVFQGIAMRNGGVVTAVVGGAMLVAFGYPQAREDDARRAAHTALRIVFEAERASEWLAERGLRLEVRVGLHTGLVIMREALHARPLELAGVTPQVASRLQELAATGEILASHDTHRLLRGAVRAEPAGERRLPELSRPLPIFRLLRDARPGRLWTIPPAQETLLVGRRAPLGQLVDAWQRTAAGRGGAILLIGEPGIGKSRLLRELRRRVPPESWLEARCMVESQASVLRPIADLFASLGEPLESMLARRGFDVAATLPPLAAALSTPLDARWSHPALTPERAKEVAFDTLVCLLFRMAADRPVVLVLEDLQWADPTTLELVSLVVHDPGAREAPILLLATARPEFVPPWPASEVAPIPITRLGADEVETMVNASLLIGQPLDRPLLDEIVRRTDGVPLFVEELTRALADGGVLERGVELPASLRDLLVARLDSLSPGARATAQLAAVLGREFRADWLRAAGEHDDASLRGDLRELADAGIAYQRRSSLVESWVFKHALVRDAAYESMTRSARQALHRRVGRTLRDRFADLRRDRPEVVAEHAEEGGELALGAEYWMHAGRRTLARAAYAESIRLLERALGLLARMPPSRERAALELETRGLLGEAYLLTRGYTAPEVQEHFARALVLCDQLGEEAPFRLIAGLWQMHIVRADAEPLTRILAQIEHLAEGSADGALLLTAHGFAGARAFYLGDFARARDEMTAASRWYDTDAVRAFIREAGYDGGINVFAIRSWALWMLGHPDEARAVREEMLATAERGGNPAGLAAALSFAAAVARDCGEVERALELATRSLTFATEQKLHFWLGPAFSTEGWALARQGRVDEGIARIRQGLAIYEMAGVQATYDYHRSALVEALLVRRETAEALTIVRDGLARCATLLDRFWEAELHRLEGEALLQQDDITAAEAAFRAALTVARQQKARSLELRAATSWARGLAGQGRHAQARAVLAPAFECFTGEHDTQDLRAAAALLDKLG